MGERAGGELGRLPRVLIVGINQNVIDVAELLDELLQQGGLVLDDFGIG